MYADAIGFAVYSYEGIGVVLPIRECTADKEGYYKLLCLTVGSIAILYVIFGEFTVLAWGDREVFDLPLVTSSLPNTDIVTYIVKIFYSLNLCFSYPLMLHPANLVVETWFFEGWPKTRKRQMCKNLSRTILVLLTCVLALLVWDDLDKLLSITGALFCTPVAFLIPAALHLKMIAKADNNKQAVIIDYAILIGGVIMLLYSAIYGAVTW